MYSLLAFIVHAYYIHTKSHNIQIEVINKFLKVHIDDNEIVELKKQSKD